MDPDSRVTSSLGFLGMFGGAMFGLLMVTSPLLLAEDSGMAVFEVVWSMVMLAMVFLVPGAVGLYLAQREAFGWASLAATVVFVGGLLLALLTGLLGLFVGSYPFQELLSLLTLVGFYFVGPIAFGIATARADELAHGRIGGALLAVSLPGAFGLLFAVDWLGASLPTLVSTSLLGVPYGLAWLVLGYDLLAVGAPEGPTPATAGG